MWDSLRSATRARCLVLFYKGRCLMQEGVAPAGQVRLAALLPMLLYCHRSHCRCGGCWYVACTPACRLVVDLPAAPGLLQAPGTASPGPICQKAMQSGTGNYLANLVLFPGAYKKGWVQFVLVLWAWQAIKP